MGVMLICSHELNVALCGIAVKNVALNLSLVGHLCSRATCSYNNCRISEVASVPSSE